MEELKDKIQAFSLDELISLRNFLTKQIIEKTDFDIELKSESILNYIQHVYGVTLDELKTKSKKRKFVEPRQAAMYFLYKAGYGSTNIVGRLFSRDHATVLHAKKNIESLLNYDRTVQKKLNPLTVILQ